MDGAVSYIKNTPGSPSGQHRGCALFHNGVSENGHAHDEKEQGRDSETPPLLFLLLFVRYMRAKEKLNERQHRYSKTETDVCEQRCLLLRLGKCAYA